MMSDYNVFKEWVLAKSARVENAPLMIATKEVYDWQLELMTGKGFKKKTKEETCFGNAVCNIMIWKEQGWIRLYRGRFGDGTIMEFIK